MINQDNPELTMGIVIEVRKEIQKGTSAHPPTICLKFNDMRYLKIYVVETEFL